MANKGSEITGSRIKGLRVEAGLNQKSFVRNFQIFPFVTLSLSP